MDNLIDSRYFRGLIELPNLNTQADFSTPSGEDLTSNVSEIDMYIMEFQEEFLIKLFGSNIIPTEVETLIVSEKILRSPIADYVFCNVINNDQSQSTESGEKIHNAVDSLSVSFQEKGFAAWNRMVKSCLSIKLSILLLFIKKGLAV